MVRGSRHPRVRLMWLVHAYSQFDVFDGALWHVTCINSLLVPQICAIMLCGGTRPDCSNWGSR